MPHGGVEHAVSAPHLRSLFNLHSEIEDESAAPSALISTLIVYSGLTARPIHCYAGSLQPRRGGRK